MKRRKACAVLCTFSILASVFSGTAVMAEENQQTEIQTEVAEEQTEAVSEQADTEEGQTEDSDLDAVKIDRDHPEGRIGVAYDQPDAWDELAMTNDEAVDTGINIRATADPEGEVLGYLYKGCAAWILNKGDEWTELYSGGMTGYVKNEYLVFGEGAKALAQTYGTDGITAMWDGVAVFAEPDGDSEVVKVLRTGDDMFVVSEEGDWLTVKLDKENTAYVFAGDIIRSLVLDSAVPKDGIYKDVEPAAEAQEEETYEETYEESYDDGSDSSYNGETYVEDYTQPETSAPQTNAPETNPPQTSAPETNPPQTSAPETSAPETSAPETSAPETTAPETSAPETSAPETSAPETSAPETSAPETSAPETSAPETSAPVIDDGSDSSIDGDEGWYDADTDTYYDANGNVIQQSADSQYTDDYSEYEVDDEVYYEEEAAAEDTYAEDTYEEDTYTDDTYAEDTYTEDTYVEDTAAEDTDTEDTYTEDTYTEETSAPETEAAASSSDDTSLLAALIYCEAGNQSYEGMVAVGAVVMNRVYSSSFPNSISEVIYQSGQFTPASSGSLASALANGVPSSCYEAASAAISGENPVGSALYFNTGSGSGIQIGDHQFY